jgi:hypothetical protein
VLKDKAMFQKRVMKLLLRQNTIHVQKLLFQQNNLVILFLPLKMPKNTSQHYGLMFKNETLLKSNEARNFKKITE